MFPVFSVLLLLLAWCAAGTACARLCLAAVRAATAVVTSAEASGSGGREREPDGELTLHEAAFLSGGPTRVVDLTLVSMARGRRLLLAHTGWVTVVDPEPEDEWERSVLGAIGPQGQSRLAPVRRAAAAADAVRGLADRLVGAGLAVPDGGGGRTTVAEAARQVRVAAAAVVALGLVALLMPEDGGAEDWLVALWFALPLLLALGCLAITRVEAHPYARWASPTGQRLLAAAVAAEGVDRELALVAVRGTRALEEPGLRAAFTHR